MFGGLFSGLAGADAVVGSDERTGKAITVDDQHYLLLFRLRMWRGLYLGIRLDTPAQRTGLSGRPVVAVLVPEAYGEDLAREASRKRWQAQHAFVRQVTDVTPRKDWSFWKFIDKGTECPGSCPARSAGRVGLGDPPENESFLDAFCPEHRRLVDAYLAEHPDAWPPRGDVD